VSIRPAKIDDADGIAAVHVASWQWFYRDLLPAELIEARPLDVRRRLQAAGLGADSDERLGARLLPGGIATDAGIFDDVVYAFDDLRVITMSENG
jgi:hypothetical protein